MRMYEDVSVPPQPRGLGASHPAGLGGSRSADLGRSHSADRGGKHSRGPSDSRWLISAQCIGLEKRTQPNKHYVYAILVSWSDGVRYPIYRRYTDFFDLCSCLQEEYKDIKGVSIPDLPALKVAEKAWPFLNREASAEKRKRQIAEFCERLVGTEHRDVLSCRITTTFFDTWIDDFAQVTSPNLLRKSPKHPRQASTLSADFTRLWALRKGSAPVAVVTPLLENLKPSALRRISHPTEPQQITPKIETSASHGRKNLTNRTENHQHNQQPKTQHTRNHSSPNPVQQIEEEESTEGQQTYRVLFPYQSKRPGEVDLVEGESVDVLEKSSTGWWFVQSEGGREEGWAPGAFLEPLDSMPQEDNQSPIYDEVGIYQAREDYSGEESDEVSCKKGETLHVIESNLDGWWKVRTSSNTEGYTPALNLEKYSSDKPTASEFSRKSASIKGLPPRRSSFKKDGESDNHNPPLYARVNKPRRRSKNKSNKENMALASEAKHNNNHHKKVEYTEVYISNEDNSVQVGPKPLMRKPTPVEYSDIVPLKIPENGIRPKSDNSPRFRVVVDVGSETGNHQPKKSSSLDTNLDQQGQDEADGELHVYQNVVGESCVLPKHMLDKASNGVAKHPLPTPRNSKGHPPHPYDNAVPQKLKGKNAKAAAKGRTSEENSDEAAESAESIDLAGENELPRMPSGPPPNLPKDVALPRSASGFSTKQCPPQYIKALCQYMPSQEKDRILNFKKGDHGVLLKKGALGWWGIKLNRQKGWVPASFWSIVEEAPPVPVRKTSTGSNEAESSSGDSASSPRSGVSVAAAVAPPIPAGRGKRVRTPPNETSPPETKPRTPPSEPRTSPKAKRTSPEPKRISPNGAVAPNKNLPVPPVNTEAPPILLARSPKIQRRKQLPIPPSDNRPSPGNASPQSEARGVNPTAPPYETRHLPPITAVPGVSTTPQQPAPGHLYPDLSQGSQRGVLVPQDPHAAVQASAHLYPSVPRGSHAQQVAGAAAPNGASVGVGTPAERQYSIYTSRQNAAKNAGSSDDITTQPWYLGHINRHDSELLLTNNGRQGDFLIRESSNKAGDFALSVLHKGKVKHFAIEKKAENKFNIGKHDFKNLFKVINYYKQKPLFFDESQQPVSLGNPVIH